MPKDTCWHFIGPLQSNKVNKLVKSSWPSLYMVETVASTKIANKLNKVVGELISQGGDGSGEGRRAPQELSPQGHGAGQHVRRGLQVWATPRRRCSRACASCRRRQLRFSRALWSHDNRAIWGHHDRVFETLVDCRDEVARALGRDPTTLELSMGMSGDFESAIALGSTNVRVGSTIFGSRDYSNRK